MKASLALLFVLVLVVSGCSGDDAEPLVVVEPTLDELVIENCELVAGAAKVYAAQYGSYPDPLSDLLPFLPNGERLVNPYTEARTEPVDGMAAQPGQTAYQVAFDNNHNIIGCNISGYGAAGFVHYISLELTLDELVIQSVYIVRDAVEQYYVENGEYPASSSRLGPFLPDSTFLVNVFTGHRTQPVDYYPQAPGEIGYQGLTDTEPLSGYRIDGHGEEDFVINIMKWPK